MISPPQAPQADDAQLGDLVRNGAAQLSVPLSATEVEGFVAYVRLIERWNATYNLTAIRDPRAMVVQHVLDCLAAAASLQRRRGAGDGERVADIGSGAGLPGIVIAMTSPGRRVTCIDSVGKKAAFIAQAAGVLQLANVTAVHARVEHVVDKFDVVASRAFSSLADFTGSTRHILSDTGIWMAMKGKTPHEELAVVADDVEFHVEPLVVPELDGQRCVVWMQMKEKASARL